MRLACEKGEIPQHLNDAIIGQVAQVLKSGRRFLLSSHVNPDGDSVGSTCALRSVLKCLGKEVTVIFQDQVPAQYRFIQGSDSIVWGESVRNITVDDGTVGVILDCNELSRVGDRVGRIIAQCRSIVVIDHHVIGDTSIGPLHRLPVSGSVTELVDSSAAATGELVYCIARELGCEISADIATSLYVAISTDTGSFKFSNTSSSCLRIAAELVDAGARPDVISDNVFDTKPIEYIRFLSHALSNLRTAAGGRIAYIVVTEESLDSYGAKTEELEGLVNYARMVDTAICGVLFSPAAPNEVKVSFRCKRNFRVDQIARHFGGGGHECAAGARIRGSMDEVVELVVTYITDVLEKTGAQG